MRNRTWCVAAIFVFVSPYSCHKPTPQESYAHAKQCYAALNTLLRKAPAGIVERAGADRSAVEAAEDGFLDASWANGKALGMRTNAISTDIERARISYVKSRNADERFTALRDDANACLGDYYGRPND